MKKTTFLILTVLAMFLMANRLLAQESELARAEALNKQVIALHNQGRFQEAIILAEEALKIRARVLSSEHPDIATSLNNLALLYSKIEEYSKAEPLYQRALEIRKKAVESEDLNVADCLNNLGELYRKMGSYTKAEPLFQQALSIRKTKLGPTHPIVAISLNNLASLYLSMGFYSKAIPLYQQALPILEKALKPEHSAVITCLNNLAELYRKMGSYAKAEPLFLKVLSIREKKFGPYHSETAEGLNNLAALYSSMGSYSKAKNLYKRALVIFEKTKNPGVVTCLNNLADLYQSMGSFTKADSLLQQVLLIQEKSLDAKNPDVAISFTNLANLYTSIGSYYKAESFYQRALEIWKKTEELDSPDVATTLTGLAQYYYSVGSYAKAEPLFQRALEIDRKTVGSEHPNLAISLTNLAELYHVTNRYDEAISLQLQALAVFEKAFGSGHQYLAANLHNLASIYGSMGQYENAKPLYQRALEILEKALGAEHPNVATSLNNLAQVYRISGSYTKAEPLYQRALLLWEKAFGAEHPNVAIGFNNLAILEVAMNRSRLAKQHLQRAANIKTAFMQNLLPYSTETEKTAFIQNMIKGEDLFINLLKQNFSTDTATVKAAYNLMLLRKTVGLDVSSQQQQTYVASNDSISQRLFQRFRELSQQIAHRTFMGPRDTAFTVYHQQLNQLSAEREQIEDNLAQRSGTFLQGKQPRQSDIAQVAEALPNGSALIEFVRYDKVNFKAKGEEQMWGSARYAIFSLTAKNMVSLQMADLGPAQPIDSLVLAYRQEIKNASNLGSRQRQAAEQRSAVIVQQLYRLLFSPIKTTLPDSGMLYCALDGPLHLLPFEILKDDSGKYLVERYQFNYLGSGRDLLRFTKTPPSSKMYVFADANFDGKPQMQIASNESSTPSNVQRSRSWRGGKFDPLDSTAIEARAIQNLFKVNEGQIFLDNKAIEQNLLSLKSPWRLHIATHGFFLKDQEDIKQLTRPEMFTSTFGEQRFGLGQFENPLLRSGLALAGANTIGQKQDSTQTYDGIATAYEISGMNLQGTDLVVLSACETGLGDIQNGEGVFGLRRAFQLAGAQTVVMSLWKVPDNETKELMIDFYTRLKNGEGKSQALRHASLSMMRKQKAKYGSAHPYFWGAFICAGNPE